MGVVYGVIFFDPRNNGVSISQGLISRFGFVLIVCQTVLYLGDYYGQSPGQTIGPDKKVTRGTPDSRLLFPLKFRLGIFPQTGLETPNVITFAF